MKIIKDVKIPFVMEGRNRIDDTLVHKALREALANCLINADYYGTRGVVIKKDISLPTHIKREPEKQPKTHLLFSV